MKKLFIILIILFASNAHAKMTYAPISDYQLYADYYQRYDTSRQPTLSFDDLKGIDLLLAVNSYVNKSIQYVDEAKGVNHWQTPTETLNLKTGDCEDYALLKMHLLKNSDIPEKNMVILGGYLDNGNQTHHANDITHAMLRVSYNNKYYYLDNRHQEINIFPLDNRAYFGVNRFGVVFNIGN